MSDNLEDLLYSLYVSHPFQLSRTLMEKSSLVKLKREVLDLEPEAALPHHLSDAWLNMLLRDLDVALHDENEDHTYLTAPLALITHILIAKNDNQGQGVTFTSEELFGYLQDLRFEISLELVRRNTNVTPEPATLQTIFTNRNVGLAIATPTERF